ncbi:glutamate receptor ionotropic, delta-2-like [Temnothorax nylanderi]|uniref:glutamate receptor ionotropic, delta-2-like n=1 Tax=Temnothorax nylanderi TaxID=102681 RepID=UPI003A8A4A55
MTVTITFSDLTSEYNKYWKNVTRPLFVVLLDTEETMDEFAETTRSIKPISFPIWLVMFLQRPGNPLEERCRHPTDNVFNVDFRTQMLVLCYARPILVEWYAIRDNRTRTFDLALWSPDRGLLLRTRKSLYARRSDMFGDVVRVASTNNSLLISHENGTVDGFFGLLLIDLSKMMNFTVEILDPVEGYGIWSNEKKVWTGAIGQLVANEADIGISAFAMTTGRQNVIDYTIPLIRSPYRLYFKEPNTLLVEWSLYLRAFSYGTWITLLMIIIAASILLTIMKTRGYFSMNLMFENYINVWGIYCQQGLSEFPSESSMRLAFLSISVSSIVILAIYSASYISNIVLCMPKLPFSTLEGYIEDGSYKLIVMQNSAEYDDLSHAKDPVFVQMYELLEEKLLPLSPTEGFKQLCERNKLAFYAAEVFNRDLNIIPCSVVYIETGRVGNAALTLTKGNPYTGLMNYHLRRFQLNGAISKLKNRYFIRDNPKEVPSYVLVELSDVTPALTMLAGSMVLALLILIIERVYYSSKTRSKNNKLPVKKLSYNLGVRNKLRKGNERNLNLQRFYNTRPIGNCPELGFPRRGYSRRSPGFRKAPFATQHPLRHAAISTVAHTLAWEVPFGRARPATPLSGFRRFQLNGVISKLKNKYLIRDNPREVPYYGLVELSDVTPALMMLAGSMVLALLILIIEKVYYSSKTRSKNNNPSRNPGKPQGNIRSK